MNRNIIFRGRELATGAWYEGFFVRNFPGAIIVKVGDYSITGTAVDPDTVQQLTNCYHHGRSVWEGDVYAAPTRPDHRFQVYYDVVFDAFRIRWSDSKTTSTAPLVALLAEHPELEYVGNIIDLDDNTDKL